MKPTAQRDALLAAALLLALVKSIQFALDSQVLFYSDSGGYILNALELAFVPFRSYVYGDLIRVFAVPFHSLRAIVVMQFLMGGLTAWLLSLALLRYLHVRASIAILAAVVLAASPMQMLYEHMIMTETAALLAAAVFLVAALEYLRSASLYWLASLGFLGAVLVGLRLVYVPVVLCAAVLIPVIGCFSTLAKRPRVLVLALVVSCGSTMLFQDGYRHLTGWLAHREPAYHYWTGFFLLASVSPLVEPGDSPDPRVAGAVEAQSKSATPLHANLRFMQLWLPEGLVAKLRAVFGADERAADQAARRLALAAIRRDPGGFFRLGMETYLDYWRGIPLLRETLPWENGTRPPHLVAARDAEAISTAFGADVGNQDKLNTLSRRYHIFGRDWVVFLLAAPFLTGLGWWLIPANPRGMALLFVWSLLLLAATCLGDVGSTSRHLHPYAFTGLAAGAVLCERVAAARGKAVRDA